VAKRFNLGGDMNTLPDALPLGIRQRLSLAVAMIHSPDILILDKPTSGVDPVARDGFWQILCELSRKQNVTLFVSTHYMNEAERCDRVSLMHAGKVVATNTPAAIVQNRSVATLEEAFIGYLEDAIGTRQTELHGDLSSAFLPLLIAIPVLLGLGIVLLRKQAR